MAAIVATLFFLKIFLCLCPGSWLEIWAVFLCFLKAILWLCLICPTIIQLQNFTVKWNVTVQRLSSGRTDKMCSCKSIPKILLLEFSRHSEFLALSWDFLGSFVSFLALIQAHLLILFFHIYKLEYICLWIMIYTSRFMTKDAMLFYLILFFLCNIKVVLKFLTGKLSSLHFFVNLELYKY